MLNGDQETREASLVSCSTATSSLREYQYPAARSFVQCTAGHRKVVRAPQVKAPLSDGPSIPHHLNNPIFVAVSCEVIMNGVSSTGR